MLIVFMMSGCVKANIDMSINKDKSMKLSVTSAVDQSLLQQYGSEGLMDEETKNEAENNGFKVDEYSDGSMKGYTLSKEFKNIDDISSDKKVNFDLEKLMNEENAQIFTVKQGFFKNTYTVTMENNTSSELESQMDFGDSTNSLDYTNDLDYNDVQETIDENYTQDSTTYGQDNSMDFSSNIDLSSISSNMDMKFNVTLPYKAIKSNATSTENDGKTTNPSSFIANLDNNPNKRIMFHCYTGRTTAPHWFIFREILGYKNAAIYDGSWQEWSSYSLYYPQDAANATYARVLIGDDDPNTYDKQNTDYIYYNGEKFVLSDGKTEPALEREEIKNFLDNCPAYFKLGLNV